MHSIKSLVARIALCFSLCFGAGHAHAGVPVIDIAAIIQAVQEYLSSLLQIENQVAQIQNQVQQIQQLQGQLQQLQQQYKSVTGARNLGDILNNPYLQNYIPKDVALTMDAVRSVGYSGLTPTAKALRDAHLAYNCADLKGDTRVRCQAQLAQPYQQKAFMTDALQKATGRIAQVQSLMRQLGTTQDPKAAQELQGRIEAENALLAHEQTQINLARGMADAEARITESAAREQQMQQSSRVRRLSEFIPQ
jgi:type IV secretion system protein VirB5